MKRLAVGAEKWATFNRLRRGGGDLSIAAPAFVFADPSAAPGQSPVMPFGSDVRQY